MKVAILASLACTFLLITAPCSSAQDLNAIQQEGVLRHLSIPYANFDTGTGDGLDIELMKRFAQYLGVRYENVPTQWSQVIADLTGKVVKPKGKEIDIVGESPIKGDVAAHGFTVIPWREKAVAFGSPTFPTQVWLIARPESPLAPITPSGDLSKDIATTTKLLNSHTVLGKPGTCLDPSLYPIEKAGGIPQLFQGSLNDLAPILIQGEVDLLLLDVPDCLVALRKWPGKTKILGPISEIQNMAPAFRNDSPQLRAAFNTFFSQIIQDGSYKKLVEKYYPDVFSYFPEFFDTNSPQQTNRSQ